MAYTGQELKGWQAGYADSIFGRPRDNPYNISTVPKSFRAYEEGYDEGEGSTTPPRGPAGISGPKGDTGSQGQPGLSGNDGADGLSFYTGIGAPVDGVNVPADSQPGDSYLDQGSGDLYTKTGVSTWTFDTNLIDVTFATQVDDTGGAPQVIYKGEAIPGVALAAASWRIQEITITTDGGGNDDIGILWADGDSDFNNIWNDRLGLSYS